MCGILGWSGDDPTVSIADALRLIHRRGPDDSGVWVNASSNIALAHVRLAILDTSSAGHQPMVSHSGRVVMVFNGEIYNYLELRQKLESLGHVFKGHTDSEVLLALFEQEGASCFQKLNGIFAAGFWDMEREVLTLVRDSMGVKPLYVSEAGGRVAFASEMKALLRSQIVPIELNREAVLHHLGFLWSPGSGTVVKGVRKVLPGHVLEIKAGRIAREWRYQDMAFHASPAPATAAQGATEVAAAVEQAVQRQMVSDVPLGAFLSGGLDSSAVVAFAQRALGSSRRLQCFSIDIKGESTANEGFADDLPYARKVAHHLDVDLHEVEVGQDMMDRLPEMIYLLDEPTPDPAALNALYIAELARSQGIKVLLSGAGGDDIFTGYRRHYALNQEGLWAWWPTPMRHLLTQLSASFGTVNPVARRFGKAFQYAAMPADTRLASYFLWMDPELAIGLLAPDFRAGLKPEDMVAPLLRTLADLPKDTEPLNKMLYLECKHFLADHNLNYTDKMGMAAGVEVRVPLLDRDLVALAGSLPVAWKQNGRVGKWIFKKAMEPYLPHEVIYRPKTGFGVPLRRWLHGPLAPLVHEVLSKSSIEKRGIFSHAAVNKLMTDDKAGRIDGAYALFGMICMELWCRQYIDGHYSVN